MEPVFHSLPTQSGPSTVDGRPSTRRSAEKPEVRTGLAFQPLDLCSNL